MARRGTGPRPTFGKRTPAKKSLSDLKENPYLTVARGPVPRERTTARWRGEGQALALRKIRGTRGARRRTPSEPVARGPVPRERTTGRWLGEGQALALREICRARSPDPYPVAIWRSQTTDVGHLNRLGALEEKLDKYVYAWYNLTTNSL